MTKPLLLLDVDGVLNPFPRLTANGHTAPAPYEVHTLEPRGAVEPVRVLLNPDHGQALASLSEVFVLVWATTWEDEANRLIAPLLSLRSCRTSTGPQRLDTPHQSCGVAVCAGRPLISRAGSTTTPPASPGPGSTTTSPTATATGSSSATSHATPLCATAPCASTPTTDSRTTTSRLSEPGRTVIDEE